MVGEAEVGEKTLVGTVDHSGNVITVSVGVLWVSEVFGDVEAPLEPGPGRNYVEVV